MADHCLWLKRFRFPTHLWPNLQPKRADGCDHLQVTDEVACVMNNWEWISQYICPIIQNHTTYTPQALIESHVVKLELAAKDNIDVLSKFLS